MIEVSLSPKDPLPQLFFYDSILKAIGLSKFMKQLAEGCKRLMEKIIELFHKAAANLSTLWRALSKAKDAMLSSLNEVVKSKSLCNDANEKMDKLKDMTTSLCNIEAIKLIKSLSGTKDRAVGVGDAWVLHVK